ncbi:MAG: HEPN domain-containing protein [candidate division WOR-3 bacterium]
MKQDLVAELVRLRLKQAQETLADARSLFEADRTPRSVINRAYYAMFYAVLALLQIIGKGSSKHAGVIGLFDKEFVKSGLFPVESSRALHEAFDERQKSDYEPAKMASREEAAEALARAQRFVEQVGEYISRRLAE